MISISKSALIKTSRSCTRGDAEEDTRLDKELDNEEDTDEDTEEDTEEEEEASKGAFTAVSSPHPTRKMTISVKIKFII
tara:strand:+ start:175 stop:411 length:237 start_codon:yes stop_codon:yes gene_type:complete